MLANTHCGRKPLGSLCELYNGYAFKPSEWKSIGKPIIRIQNLNGGQDFNFYNGELPERYSVTPGTLLFAWSGNRGTSFGPYVWNGAAGFLNQHVFKVVTNEGVDEGWFFYALDAVREQVERNAHGASGLVHVRKEDLCKYIVLVPTDIEEQRTIATILANIDDAIYHTESLIEKLKRVRAGMLHDFLTRGLDENGELRDSNRHPEQFKDSPLGRIPVEWKCCQLGDALLRPPRNGYSPPEAHAFGGGYILGLGCITSEGFVPRQLKNAPKGHSAMEPFLLKHGDLLLSRSNTIDLVALPGVFQDVGYPCYYPDLIMRLSPRPELDPFFLELILRHNRSRSLLVASANGTSSSMMKITGASVMATTIVYPEKKTEQTRILANITASNQEICVFKRELNKLNFLKTGLMRDLLTGKVRVTEVKLK